MAGKWADMGRAPYSVARVRIVRIALIVAPRALSPPPTADALQEASLRDAVVTQPLCAPARTALVLAGGGAKGAAHIGVIEVLDSLDIHPDIVVRTSIGSIVGALYASGYSGREIDSLGSTSPIGSLFQPYRPRLPPLIGVGLRPFTVWEMSGSLSSFSRTGRCTRETSSRS
jgi:hypothetical protein